MKIYKQNQQSISRKIKSCVCIGKYPTTRPLVIYNKVRLQTDFNNKLEETWIALTGGFF